MSVLLILTGLSATHFISCADAGSEAPTPERTDAHPFELHLSLAEGEILPSQPAVVRLSLSNTSEEPQTVVTTLQPEAEYLTYEIIGPSGQARRHEPILHATVIVDPRQLAPGGKLLDRHLLLYSARGGVHFADPGQYTIRAAIAVGLPGKRLVTLRSNTVTLTVRAATGGDAEALEHFRGNPQALFALGVTHEWIIGREFETILRKYPNCSYAPWCYYFLARAWPDHPLRNAQLKSERAVRMFETLLEKYPDFPLTLEVRFAIARELLRLGHEEEAFRQLHELIEANPDWVLFQRVKFQMNVYRDSPPKYLLQALDGLP